MPFSRFATQGKKSRKFCFWAGPRPLATRRWRLETLVLPARLHLWLNDGADAERTTDFAALPGDTKNIANIFLTGIHRGEVGNRWSFPLRAGRHPLCVVVETFYDPDGCLDSAIPLLFMFSMERYIPRFSCPLLINCVHCISLLLDSTLTFYFPVFRQSCSPPSNPVLQENIFLCFHTRRCLHSNMLDSNISWKPTGLPALSLPFISFCPSLPNSSIIQRFTFSTSPLPLSRTKSSFRLYCPWN